MTNLEQYAKNCEEEFIRLMGKYRDDITNKENIEVRFDPPNIIYKTGICQIAIRVDKFLNSSCHLEYKNYQGGINIIIKCDLALLEEKISKAIKIINILVESAADFGKEEENVIYI